MDDKVAKRNQQKNDWQLKNRDRFSLLFPKNSAEGVTKAQVKAAADATKGGSMSAWIMEAIAEKMERERDGQ